MALSGAGSVAASSGIADSGTLNISATTAGTSIKTLSGAGAVTLGARPLTLTAGSTTFSGVIGGTGGLTLSGGTETLSGTNTYSGVTTISSGATLALSGAGIVAASSGITDSGTFDISATAAGTSIKTLSGAGVVTLGAQPLMLTAGSTTFSGVIGGTGGLTLSGGTETLSGVNSFSGPTTINSGATLALSGAGSVAASSGIADSGTFDISATTAGTSIKTLSGAGAVTLGAQPLVLTAGSTTFSGVIGGTGGLTLSGGTETLSGGNTYSGGTTINGGSTLTLSHASGGGIDATGTGPIKVVSGTLETSLTGALANALTFDSTSAAKALEATGATTLTLTGALNVNAPTAFGSATDAGTIIFAQSSATGSASAALEVAGGTSMAALGNGSLGALTGALATTQVDAGATLDFNGNAATIFNLQGNTPSGGGTIRDDSSTLTIKGGNFAGQIIGTTNLSLAGGTLTLSGINSYTGATALLTGTLRGGAADSFAPLSPVIVASAATLDLGGFNEVIGSLAGAGAVSNSDPRLAVLTAGGDNTSTVFSGVIHDDGPTGFTKTGTGTLTLSGVNTYSGPTTVAGGVLDVEGSIANSGATVERGATLGGGGTVGSVMAQTGGTVAPGLATSFATLNVLDNVTFGAGSTFLVKVDAAGQNDKLAAGGTASLQGGTVQVAAGSGTYLPTTRFTLLTANGGISGTFASLATSTNLAFLSPTLSYDANDVFLGFTQAITPSGTPVVFASVAATRNQASTATAVQALGLSNPIFKAIVGLSAAAARQSFDALSGEIHASVVTAAYEDSRLPRDAILDRLDAVAAVQVPGGSMVGDAYAGNLLPSSKGPMLAPVSLPTYAPRFGGLWGQGFGDWGSIDTDHNAAKLTRDTRGFIIGADADVLQLTGRTGLWRLGIAGGYTDDNLKVSDRSSSGDIQSIFAALYGGANFGAIDLKAGAVTALTDTRTRRSIAFPGFSDVASSSHGGNEEQAFAELGYHLPFHCTLWSYLPGLSGLDASYEPFLQGAIIHLAQDTYAETALMAGLGGAAKSYDLGVTTLGLRSQYTLTNLPGFMLRTMLGWRHAFGDVKPLVDQGFAGSFADFTVAGVPIARDAFVSETSLDYRLSTDLTVGLSYASQLGRKTWNNGLKAQLEMRF